MQRERGESPGARRRFSARRAAVVAMGLMKSTLLPRARRPVRVAEPRERVKCDNLRGRVRAAQRKGGSGGEREGETESREPSEKPWHEPSAI